MDTKRFPIELAIPIQTRPGTGDVPTLDSYTRNTLQEITTSGNCVFKRPGTTFLTIPHPTLIGQPGQGIFERSGYLYGVAGNTIFTETSVPPVPLPLSSPGEAFPITTVNDVTLGGVNYSLIQTEEGLWYFDGAAATYVADSDFPAGLMVPGLVLLDGTYYVMDIYGYIHGSDVADFTAWDALNVTQVDPGMGKPVQLLKHLNYVMAVMEFGVQLFFDAGNATGSPLSPVQNAAWKIGAPKQLYWMPAASIGDDTFIFVRTRKSTNIGGFQVWQLSGLQFSVVSNAHIDRLLGAVSTLAYDDTIRVSLSGLQIEGHNLLIVTRTLIDGSPGSYTLVYDINMQVWTLWDSSNADGSQRGHFDGQWFWKEYFQPLDNKFIGLFDKSSTFTDGLNTNPATQVPVVAEILIPPTDFKTVQRKFLPALYLIADTVNSTVAISWSDDDGATYSTPRTVDLNTAKKMLQRCGSSRRRSWKITHGVATSMRLYSMELEVEGGAG
jgi:hypothetical protein